MTLTSVTSWSEVDILVTADATRAFGELIGVAILEVGQVLSDVSYPFGQEKLTQEIRLTSPTSNRFEWLVGAFYTDEDNEVEQTVSLYDPVTGALLPGVNPAAVVQLPNEYQEYAIFTNGTYKFTERSTSRPACVTRVTNRNSGRSASDSSCRPRTFRASRMRMSSLTA